LFKIRRMADVQAPPALPKSQPFFARRHSTILKLLGVGVLVQVLEETRREIPGRAVRMWHVFS
jgi:hypothetical protein